MSAPSQVYQYYSQRVGTGGGLQDVCGDTIGAGAVIDQQPFPPGAPGTGVRKFQQTLQTRGMATHLQLRSQHGSGGTGTAHFAAGSHHRRFCCRNWGTRSQIPDSTDCFPPH